MMPSRVALALAAAAATGALPFSPARAQQSHSVDPRILPQSFRDRLLRGEVARVSRGAVDTVRAAPSSVRPQVSLRPGEVLVARTGDRATATATATPTPGGGAPADTVFRLPYTYVGLDRAGSSAMVYRPFYVPQGPLRYRPEQDAFAGTFLLGLQDTAAGSRAEELGTPVRVRFGFGDVDSIAPDSVVLRQTNAQLELVHVFASTAMDSVRVLVVPASDPRGVGIWLRVQPALAFDQVPSRIQGLGVEGATVVVGVRGTRLRDSIPVSLSVSRGSLESNRVLLSEGGSAVKLHSAGLGAAVLTARAPGVTAIRTTIVYGWPAVFVLAALLGGVLGALAAYVNAKRRTRQLLVRYLVRGVVVALAVCVVYFGIGINLLQFQVDVRYFNEIAVFALAVLAAMFGIPTLGALASKGGKPAG